MELLHQPSASASTPAGSVGSPPLRQVPRLRLPVERQEEQQQPARDLPDHAPSPSSSQVAQELLRCPRPSPRPVAALLRPETPASCRLDPRQAPPSPPCHPPDPPVRSIPPLAGAPASTSSPSSAASMNERLARVDPVLDRASVASLLGRKHARSPDLRRLGLLLSSWAWPMGELPTALLFSPAMQQIQPGVFFVAVYLSNFPASASFAGWPLNSMHFITPQPCIGLKQT